jgi:hypothetical protein
MDVNPKSEVSIFDSLARPFSGFAVRWRIGRKSKNGDKAMPLAYIDARDVMDRLDGVVGPQNWQSKYIETNSGRVLCELSILLDGQWITKSDGAGDTQVEREKGAISDAFKRAAVHWGIGRYLYAMDAPWLPIDKWSQFTDSSKKRLAQIADNAAGMKQPTKSEVARWIPSYGALLEYDAEDVDKLLATVGMKLADVDAFCDSKDRPRLEAMLPEQLNKAVEFFLSNKGVEALTTFRGSI